MIDQVLYKKRKDLINQNENIVVNLKKETIDSVIIENNKILDEKDSNLYFYNPFHRYNQS